MNAVSQQRSTFRIDFIDPLFAIAVHLGIAESLATTVWFKEGRLPSSGDEMFPFFGFLLGMTTLVLSWVGYHQSIATKPLKGLVRFVIDILLVVGYAIILMQVDHFNVVVVGLVWTYGLFAAWD